MRLPGLGWVGGGGGGRAREVVVGAGGGWRCRRRGDELVAAAVGGAGGGNGGRTHTAASAEAYASVRHPPAPVGGRRWRLAGAWVAVLNLASSYTQRQDNLSDSGPAGSDLSLPVRCSEAEVPAGMSCHNSCVAVSVL